MIDRALYPLERLCFSTQGTRSNSSFKAQQEHFVFASKPRPTTTSFRRDDKNLSIGYFAVIKGTSKVPTGHRFDPVPPTTTFRATVFERKKGYPWHLQNNQASQRCIHQQKFSFPVQCHEETSASGTGQRIKRSKRRERNKPARYVGYRPLRSL